MLVTKYNFIKRHFFFYFRLVKFINGYLKIYFYPFMLVINLLILKFFIIYLFKLFCNIGIFDHRGKNNMLIEVNLASIYLFKCWV